MQIASSAIPNVILASKDCKNIVSLSERLEPSWVFILGGSAGAVVAGSKLLKDRGFTVFVHIDMIHGFSKDPEGIRLLKDLAEPTGVISTHPSVVTAAHKVGLMAIERIFLLDSSSVESGLRNVMRSQPDAVEVLPGILPAQIEILASKIAVPLIAGGLITTVEQVAEAIKSGAHGISTSSERLFIEYGQYTRREQRIGVMNEKI